MRTLLALPPVAMAFGFMAGAGVPLSGDLIPVAVIVCLAYAMLALVEVVPEAVHEYAQERRLQAERRWAEARAAVSQRY